jgi:arylsulfatase A
MQRRDFIKSAGITSASFLLPGLVNLHCQNESQTLDKPNIVLIFTDDQGTLDAHCYGSEDLYTPNLDALANSGIRFTQAYSHAVCCPARAPLLTGRFPQRGNINNWTPCHPDRSHPFGKGPNMDLEEQTIAEILQQNGYRTALFGKWHLGATPGFGPNEQGFDEFYGHLGGFIDNYSHKFLHRGEFEDGTRSEPFHDLYRNHEEIFADGQYFPDLVVNECFHFLEQNRENPFFMYVALNVPHYPEQADKKFTEMYKNLPMPRRSYAAMVSTTDDRIGKIIGKVDELGLRENTLFIWMSDNGHSTEGFYPLDRTPPSTYYSAHGGGGNTGSWRGAKGCFFEGGIRVPAIISMPNIIPQGQVRNQAIINADFFPTILELCKINPPNVTIDGKSMWPIIRSPEVPSQHQILYWQWQNQWAVREGDWKLIGNGRDTTGKHSKHLQREGRLANPFLANLKEDLPEWENFAEKQPQIVERLQKLHDAWWKDVNSPFPVESGKGKGAG